MKTSRVKILITCAGSGVGQSVVDSLRHRKDRYFVLASDQGRYRYSIPDCDDFVELPRISDPEYVDAVLDCCQRHNVDLLIPGHDMELAPFARHRHQFESADVQVMVSDVALVQLLRDKLAWARCFRDELSCIVPSASAKELLAGDADFGVTYPVIAKPVGGSASSGLRIIHKRKDLEGLSGEYVVQSFLFPARDDPDYQEVRDAVASGRVVQVSEISVQLVYSREGEVLGRFASRNRLKAGVPVEIDPVNSEAVWSAVAEVERVLADRGPRGPVNLQGRMTDAGLVFFEMNPRFTGITGNRAQFGFNEVTALVDNFVEGIRRPLRFNPGKVGVRQVACRTWSRRRFRFDGADPEVARILVLGGTSWLGRQVVRARAAAGAEVIVVSRPSSAGSALRLYAGLPTVTVVGDDDTGLDDVFGWADVLVNCVSGRPPSGTGNIASAYRYQIQMLSRAAVRDLPRIVNISSQSVYAAADRSWSEDAALDLSHPYAFSKYAVEEHVRSLSMLYPAISAVSLRLSRLFGPVDGLRAQEFPHRVVQCGLDGSTIQVHAPGTVLDLLDIRDAATAVEFFIDRGTVSRGEVFNIGSGAPITTAEYVALCDRVSRKLGGAGVTMFPGDGARAAGGALDCRRIHALGWTPRLMTQQSVEDLFRYLADVRA